MSLIEPSVGLLYSLVVLLVVHAVREGRETRCTEYCVLPVVHYERGCDSPRASLARVCTTYCSILRRHWVLCSLAGSCLFFAPAAGPPPRRGATFLRLSSTSSSSVARESVRNTGDSGRARAHSRRRSVLFALAGGSVSALARPRRRMSVTCWVPPVRATGARCRCRYIVRATTTNLLLRAVRLQEW
jgi:hypothetical protein